MKILNLYSGLGGNRKKWQNVDVTAVEINEEIAEYYSNQFPDDEIIVGDAHEYLRLNYDKFDFIWSSPPCPTHSKMMIATRHDLRVYPEMSLYQEIIFLDNFFKGRFVVENVRPYYKPLIKPSFILQRHFFWTNFQVLPMKGKKKDNFILLTGQPGTKELIEWLGMPYDKNIYMDGTHDPLKPLRNCVHPDLGLHIFEESKREGLFNLNDIKT